MTRILVILLSTILLTTFLYFKFDSSPDSSGSRALNPWQKKAAVETPQTMRSIASAPNHLKNWPPVPGKTFPHVALYDHTGQEFDLQTLKGKPTLIEVASMTCAGCQGYSGGNKHGGFGGFAAQKDLASIEEYYRRFTGGKDLFSGEINFVQLIIYNLRLEPPIPAELSAWREHFHFDQRKNTSIIAGGGALANGASYRMIPGFLLLDDHLIVRYDATGHHPRHNLYNELLPAIPELLKDS